MVLFTVVKRASQVDDRAHFDCISLKELQAYNGTSLCILTQDPPSVLDRMSIALFEVLPRRGVNLNRLGHVLTH